MIRTAFLQHHFDITTFFFEPQKFSNSQFYTGTISIFANYSEISKIYAHKGIRKCKLFSFGFERFVFFFAPFLSIFSSRHQNKNTPIRRSRNSVDSLYFSLSVFALCEIPTLIINKIQIDWISIDKMGWI